MPSYRVTLNVGTLRPGVSADSVLPAAAAAAAELTVVEASELTVVAGTARVIVRFAAEDGRTALAIGQHVIERALTLVGLNASLVTERVKDRWLPVG